MSLQRQHFLLSYLKTLSVGPAGVLNLRPHAQKPDAQPTEPTVGDRPNFVVTTLQILVITQITTQQHLVS